MFRSRSVSPAGFAGVSHVGAAGPPGAGNVRGLFSATGRISRLRLGRTLFMGDGFARALYVFVWQVALFLARGESFMAFGGALAIAANALSAFAGCLYIPTVMTSSTRSPRPRPAPLRFHVAAEAGWDLGGASGLILSAILTWWGAPSGVCCSSDFSAWQASSCSCACITRASQPHLR